MSAIERYYSSLPVIAGPWCAEDEEDGSPLTDEEIAAMYEYAMQDF